jgi:hypothetical protein
MSNETDRLEREAELHRRRLDSTLAEIESKFSPGAIVDELSGYLRDGQGATMVRNLNRQVRDNPLALGVIGAGVAWLLMGKGVRRSAGTVRERYQDWRQHDREDDTQYRRSEFATSDQNQSYTQRYDERDPRRKMNLEEDRPMSENGNGSGDYGDFPELAKRQVKTVGRVPMGRTRVRATTLSSTMRGTGFPVSHPTCAKSFTEPRKKRRRRPIRRAVGQPTACMKRRKPGSVLFALRGAAAASPVMRDDVWPDRAAIS